MSAFLLSASALLCQPIPAPVFDAASIKVSSPERGSGHQIPGDNIHVTPGSVTMSHVTLKASVAWAYHVFEYQVSGPSWMDSDSYDIAAKAAGPAQESELRLMLQGLLADRFQLTLHRQTKERQAYVLSVGKNGPRFQESATEGESEIQPDQKSMSLKVRRVSLAQLMDPLSRLFQMPVVDMTGLTGRYDVAIDLAKYMPQSGERFDPLSLIRTALEQELGLKLEARKVSLDQVIVDHAAKTPTAN